MADARRTKFTRGFYPSYHFVDHDPILDSLDTLRSMAQRTDAQITADSRVTRSTLRNWRTRKTKRPQFATIKAVVHALGGALVIQYSGASIVQTIDPEFVQPVTRESSRKIRARERINRRRK